ncbi:MAG: AI-2E family transporter [Candidatus Rokubacteria bacterium]|nr:AI-2E family transporter [Candidatus Rokubacteria bacterium]
MAARRVPGFFMLAGLVLVIAILSVARSVLMPVALAVLLAFLLNPGTRLLERVLSRAGAVTLMVVLAFGGLGAGGYLLSQQLSSLAVELPKYRTNIRQRIADIRGASRGGAIESLQSAARDVMQELDRDDDGKAKTPAPERVIVRETPGPTSVWALPVAARPIVEALVQAGLVIALVGFLLARQQELRHRFIRLVGEHRLTMATKAVDEATERISRYLLALSAVNTAFGITVGVGLFLIGLPYALLWAVIAATLRFIPYVGGWTAALLPITLSLAVFEGWREPLMVIALFVVVEPLFFLVIEPLVYGHRVGVSEFGLLVAVAFWTWLWGPIGLFLAVPLTVCLVVLGKYVPELSFLDVLIGEEPEIDPALACYQRLLAGDHGEASDIMERHLDPHRPAAVYDEVLAPALAYAKRERAWDRISDDDRAVVARGAREILESVAPPPAPPGPHAIRVVACPVRDELDELGFVMLHHLLDPAEWAIELASAEMLSSEVVAFVADRAPAVVCLGVVGHGSVAHARYVVKRLRAAFPASAIVIGRWGVAPFSAEEVDALRRAGARSVTSTLTETREQLRAAVAIERSRRAAA